MNANGRRVRQANNRYRHLARICGGNVLGGRPIHASTTSGGVAEAIARERAAAARENARKSKKK